MTSYLGSNKTIAFLQGLL